MPKVARGQKLAGASIPGNANSLRVPPPQGMGSSGREGGAEEEELATSTPQGH